MRSQETKYDELNKPTDEYNIELDLSTTNKIDSLESYNTEHAHSQCQQQRNYCKLIFHSILFISFIIFIIIGLPIRLFIFSEIIIILIMFDIFYLCLMIFSPHLHWFHFDLISIDGIFSMTVPVPAPPHCTAYSRMSGMIKRTENKFKLMGSISELSAYPGSTSNYILQSCSSYILIAMSILTVLIMDEQYHYNFRKYALEISCLFMIYFGVFGFFLAGHWSVFENKLSTMLHVIGFFALYLLSNIAIWIQQKAHWLCIMATLISIVVLVFYSRIRNKYLQTEFTNRKQAHKYSIYEILLEWIVVLIIQAQCGVFMWTALNG